MIDLIVALSIIALGLLTLVVLNEYVERKRKKEKSV